MTAPDLPGCLYRIIRVLYAAPRSLRTREVTYMVSPPEAEIAITGGIGPMRTACTKTGHRLSALQRLGYVERTTVIRGEVTHPWRLTQMGLDCGRLLPPWIYRSETLDNAARMVL